MRTLQSHKEAANPESIKAWMVPTGQVMTHPGCSEAGWQIRRPTGDERARCGHQSLCSTFQGISLQSLCPSPFKPLHNPPRSAHFPRRPLILDQGSASWRASWSKKLPSKTSSNKFQKNESYNRKTYDF